MPPVEREPEGEIPGVQAFRAEPQGVSDGVATVVVTGEVDVATAPALRDVLHNVLAEGATRVRLDLTDVAFIDSAGLGVLIGVLKRVREHGGEIELHHLQPAPRKVVEITGLDELFVLVD